MPALRRFLLAAGFAWLLASPATAQEDWARKVVITKRDGIKLSLFDEKGKVVREETVVGFGQQVREEKHGWLLIQNGVGGMGWIEKVDAVTLEDAVAFFMDRVNENPTDADALTRRGASLIMTTKKVDDAFRDFDDAIRLDPKNSYAFSWRGDVWMQKKKADEAIADCSEALRLNPKNTHALQTRMSAWSLKGDQQKMRADAAELLQIDPTAAAEVLRIDPTNEARGGLLMMTGDNDKALAVFTEAIRRDPKNATNYSNRGAIWALKKAYDKAIADYTEGIRLNPQSPFIYMNRAEACLANKDFDKSITDYSEAIRLNPKIGSMAFCGRGMAYFMKKDYARAQQDFDQAEKHAGGMMLMLNYSKLGEDLASSADARFRDGKKAVELALKAVKLGDKIAIPEVSASAYIALAAAYAETGDFAEAVRWQERAMVVPAIRDVPDMRRRLELYRDKKPYRQE